MSEYKRVECKSWHEFKSTDIPNLCGAKPFERGRYLFRGHGSEEWSLVSSFDRAYIRIDNISRRQKVKLAEELIDLFKKEAEGWDDDNPAWKDDVGKLALAQHHGVPTRLLDWTESPYIAAFFAFAGIAMNPTQEKNVAVWCLDTASDVWSSASGVDILELPSYGNDRLRNQLGKFTLMKSPVNSLEEYVQAFGDEDTGTSLIKFLIPSSDVMIALADLDVMGINYPRLFSGLDGCAKAATMRIRFQANQQNTMASVPKDESPS